MAESARYYTPAEAGVISGLGRKAIDNAIDKKVIPILGRGKAGKADKARGAKTWRRRLISEPELVWIYASHEARGAIPGDQRADLFNRYLENVGAPEMRLSPVLILDLASAQERIADRAARLERARRNIVSDPDVLGGEPVFRGTRVPVYDVAASARKGISHDRIRAAYTGLDEEAIDLALLYAEASPPLGRPRSASRTRLPLIPVEEKVVRLKPSR